MLGGVGGIGFVDYRKELQSLPETEAETLGAPMSPPSPPPKTTASLTATMTMTPSSSLEMAAVLVKPMRKLGRQESPLSREVLFQEREDMRREERTGHERRGQEKRGQDMRREDRT